jgi:nucleotide-binding universal stress UspA family protein
MYDRILVAMDYSEMSKRALQAALELALLSHGEVWVLHLREREIVAKAGMLPSKETYGEAEKAVKTTVDTLIQAGVKAHGEVRNTLFGYTAADIVQDAREHDIDIIVMGSRGLTDLAGLVLGSTAHKVIHLADRPVLVVR